MLKAKNVSKKKLLKGAETRKTIYLLQVKKSNVKIINLFAKSGIKKLILNAWSVLKDEVKVLVVIWVPSNYQPQTKSNTHSIKTGEKM